MTDNQLTRADLERMSAAGEHADIVQARRDGRLNVAMGLPAPHKPGDILTRDDVRKLAAEGRHTEIAQARAEGRITYTDPTTD